MIYFTHFYFEFFREKNLGILVRGRTSAIRRGEGSKLVKIREILIKNCQPGGGRGSKIRKNCRLCLWMVPKFKVLLKINIIGGFQLLDLIIPELKSHMLKIQGLSLVEILFFKKNPLQDLLSSLNVVISTNERT